MSADSGSASGSFGMRDLDSAVQSRAVKAFRHLYSVMHFGLIPMVLRRIYSKWASISMNNIRQIYSVGGSRGG